MEDIKRLLLECRYLISLNKSYSDLSKIIGVSEQTIYDDLNIKLKEYDSILYRRVSKILQKI